MISINKIATAISIFWLNFCKNLFDVSCTMPQNFSKNSPKIWKFRKKSYLGTGLMYKLVKYHNYGTTHTRYGRGSDNNNNFIVNNSVFNEIVAIAIYIYLIN